MTTVPQRGRPSRVRHATAGAWVVAPVLAAIVAVLAASGCGRGDLPLEQVDPAAVPLDPDFALVYDIFDRECIPCHSGSGPGDAPAPAPGRDGAAAVLGGSEPGLSTCADIIANLSDIEKDVFRKNSMPPGAWPRLTSQEKLILFRWIGNGAKAPCN